jgi:hypothetical protein
MAGVGINDGEVGRPKQLGRIPGVRERGIGQAFGHGQSRHGAAAGLHHIGRHTAANGQSEERDFFQDNANQRH